MKKTFYVIFSCILLLSTSVSYAQYEKVVKEDKTGNIKVSIFFPTYDMISFEKFYLKSEDTWIRFIKVKQYTKNYYNNDNFNRIEILTGERKGKIYNSNDFRWKVEQVAGKENNLNWISVTFRIDDEMQYVFENGLKGWTINGDSMEEICPNNMNTKIKSAIKFFFSDDIH